MLNRSILPDGVVCKRCPPTCRSPKPCPISWRNWRSCSPTLSTWLGGVTVSCENRRPSVQNRRQRVAPCQSSRLPDGATRPLRAVTPLAVRISLAPCASSKKKKKNRQHFNTAPRGCFFI